MAYFLSFLPSSSPSQGTSAEYFFYTTLVSMLKQVVRYGQAAANMLMMFILCPHTHSNSNPVTQRMELQQVYEWFSLNKPLMSSVSDRMYTSLPLVPLPTPRPLPHQKTNPRHHKPILSMANQLPEPLLRPQTAPASLYHSSSSSSTLSPHRPSSAAAHRRPHTTQQHGFTSSYMSRSLALDVGQLPGQPHTSVATPTTAQSRQRLSRKSGRCAV